MRFLIIRRADAQTEAGVMPSQELIDDMMEFNTQLMNSGAWVLGDGLKSEAIRRAETARH